MKKIFVLCFLIPIFVNFLAGCSSAGPFITDIQKNERGFIVQKCMVQLNPVKNAISNDNCYSQNVEF